MNQYKVCVYAISKNEEKFVERWVASMKEADSIYVLDTGSTDDTVKKLQKLGVHVFSKRIDPWRFDVARNESLKLVPDDVDICVCTDLDEVLLPGWREELEKVWQKDTNRCRYTYNWSLDQNNKPIVSFYYEKIHSRKNYRWIYPVHEILEYSGKEENYVLNDQITLNHYPDATKSRGSYLNLLELSVKEHPDNDRNTHYLGREYMYHKEYQKAIDMLEKHLTLKSATWKDERCASMRFIGRCYKYLGRYKEAEMWYLEAIREASYLRDPYVEIALLYYEQENYEKVFEYCMKAKKIPINQKSYINEVFTFDETVDDLLSISCFYLENYEDSLKYVNEAILINPDNERLLKNKEIIEKKKA